MDDILFWEKVKKAEISEAGSISKLDRRANPAEGIK